LRTEVAWHVDNDHRQLKVQRRGAESEEPTAPTPPASGEPT
jgi:hypothetical protein